MLSSGKARCGSSSRLGLVGIGPCVKQYLHHGRVAFLARRHGGRRRRPLCRGLFGSAPRASSSSTTPACPPERPSTAWLRIRPRLVRRRRARRSSPRPRVARRSACLRIRPRLVRVGSAREQQLHHARVAILSGDVARRAPSSVVALFGSAPREQQLHHARVAFGGDEARRGSVLVLALFGSAPRASSSSTTPTLAGSSVLGGVAQREVRIPPGL